MSNFGPLNQHVSLANHSLVLIDAPILVEEDRVRKQQGQEGNQWLPKELKEAKFINSLNSGGSTSVFSARFFFCFPGIAERLSSKIFQICLENH